MNETKQKKNAVASNMHTIASRYKMLHAPKSSTEHEKDAKKKHQLKCIKWFELNWIRSWKK